MEVYFMLKNPKTIGEEDPFYSPQRKLVVWGKTGILGVTGNSRSNFWLKSKKFGPISGSISGLNQARKWQKISSRKMR
jgi:hypothetical protein